MNRFNMLSLTGSMIFALLLSFSMNLLAASAMSGYRDNVENVRANKGIALQFYKKMTDANMEHFSLHNTNSFAVQNIKGVINYKTMEGEVFESRDFTIDEQIGAGSAKLTSLKSFDQKSEYSFHMNFDPRGIPPGVTPFMVDIKILSLDTVKQFKE